MDASSLFTTLFGANTYSAAGDRQAADLGKYRQQWERLEGREPKRQQEQAKAQRQERDNSPGMSL